MPCCVWALLLLLLLLLRMLLLLMVWVLLGVLLGERGFTGCSGLPGGRLVELGLLLLLLLLLGAAGSCRAHPGLQGSGESAFAQRRLDRLGYERACRLRVGDAWGVQACCKAAQVCRGSPPWHRFWVLRGLRSSSRWGSPEHGCLPLWAQRMADQPVQSRPHEGCWLGG